MELLSAATPLLPEVQSAATPGKSSRATQAAEQFEALMIGEMMKTVREAGSDGWMGSGEETGDDSAVGMAEAQFSQALASRGGFGLAKMIEHNLNSHTQKDNASADKFSIGSR